jgi:hypothetical protein
MLGDHLPGLRVHKGTAAGGDDARTSAQQTLEHALFQRPEFRLAVPLEEISYCHSRDGFDLVIAVDERKFKRLRYFAANRGFACAHQTNEYEGQVAQM